MKVIIATEGSEFSNAAIDKFCQMFGANEDVHVRVVSVFQPAMIPAAPFAISPEFVQQIDDLARRHALTVAETAGRRLRQGLAFTAQVKEEVHMGAPEQVIVELAEEWRADLIVTGSHGHGFLKRAWLGSVSSGIVHHAPCSVLVIRKDGRPEY